MTARGNAKMRIEDAVIYLIKLILLCNLERISVGWILCEIIFGWGTLK